MKKIKEIAPEGKIIVLFPNGNPEPTPPTTPAPKGGRGRITLNDIIQHNAGLRVAG